jgi:hypothetical protein
MTYASATTDTSALRPARDHWDGQGQASTAPVVGTGTLRRLRALETDSRPLLSLYIDLYSERCQRLLIAAEAALEASMSSIRAQVDGASIEGVREFLQRMPPLTCKAPGAALFASIQGPVYEVIPLPDRVQTMAVLDTILWLEPLAGMFTRGDLGVAVVDRHTARLFRGDPRTLVEFATVPAGRRRGHSASDWSGLRGREPTERCLVEDVRRLAALLMRAHRRRIFELLVVAAPCELWPLIEDALPTDLRGRLVGVVADELADASAPEVASAIAEVTSQASRDETRQRRISTSTDAAVRYGRSPGRARQSQGAVPMTSVTPTPLEARNREIP